MSDNYKPRLRSQISRGEPILFLGAGFSLGAKGRDGQSIPSTPELTEEFWRVAFPGDPFDAETRVGDAFHAARKRDRRALQGVVTARLTVDADSLPGSFATWFSMPWIRCYTLNIDDLELAVARKFKLPRGIRAVSVTTGATAGSTEDGALEVVHLNGMVGDALEDLTFTESDYAKRQTAPDKWLAECVADILSRPVLFVGTSMSEPTLWQYIEYRQSRARGVTELRPGSYLIVPKLNPARAAVLSELNADHISMDAQAFAGTILSDMKDVALEGMRVLQEVRDAHARTKHPRLISELATSASDTQTEYFLGQEPTWSDIRVGRAVTRDSDGELYAAAKSILSGKKAALIIGGTAGAGKSTSIMRLGLRLTAEGVPVYWIDERSNFEPYRLRELVDKHVGPLAVLVDDADLWNRIASGWAREMPLLREGVLFGLAVRSSKIDGLFDGRTLAGTEAIEISMPPLADSDIDELIAALDKANRLGVLKGKSPAERVAAFKNEAGRQLLVAMIQATSGKRFKEKAFEEFQELSADQRPIYATICVVSAQRFTIDREEILLALGPGTSNQTLNALEGLVRRHVVVRDDVHTGYSARHRMIADEVVSGMQERAYLKGILEGIAFAFASRVSPDLQRTNRLWRRLIRFTNHDFVLRIGGLDIGRAVYERIESVLDWDWQYWLQRGSLEVEAGDLNLASQFLDQARSMAGGERLVETEYAYLLMKKASSNPRHPSAAEWFGAGSQTLEEMILSYGRDDPYPYHVLGSQVLSWARRADMGRTERQSVLRRALDIVLQGVERHPRNSELAGLAADLKQAWLSTSVVEARAAE